MSDSLVSYLKSHFGAKLQDIGYLHGEVTIEVDAGDFLSVCNALKDTAVFHFEQLIDLCGIDYLHYGRDEWQTKEASSSGFSRAVNADKQATSGRMKFGDEVELGFDGKRFASVLHLLSYKNNQRLRVRVYAEDNDFPVVPSVVDIWNSANWYERESFDLYGILYKGHPDLRRILTDYGFVGHPFRKDFPLVGNVEMRYDPELERVVYEPVSIKPRVLVPKVIRPEEKYQASSDNKTEE